jgi:chromosome partitioning protein
MRTIAVMNQKGGCGKTTVAINLGSALSRLDRRVLLIDLDPQAHATIGLGIRDRSVELTSYELLMDPSVRVADAGLRVTDQLSIVASSAGLGGVEQELADKMGREHRLSEKLAQLEDERFDVVMIDCPPSVGLLTFNALIASREVMIPVDASYFAFHGLSKLRETIEVIEEELKQSKNVHVLCNNLDTRTHFSNEMLEEIDRFHGAAIMDTYISNTVRLKEAAAKGVSIFDLDGRAKASRQFLSLAREFAEKEPKIITEQMDSWIEKLHGPKKVPEGVLFTFSDLRAKHVAVTGEFTNWSREGIPMQKESEEGLWKIVLDIQPGEYEYRFIVDGVWVRDPNNQDYIRNEFGQENSLLIV